MQDSFHDCSSFGYHSSPFSSINLMNPAWRNVVSISSSWRYPSLTHLSLIKRRPIILRIGSMSESSEIMCANNRQGIVPRLANLPGGMSFNFMNCSSDQYCSVERRDGAFFFIFFFISRSFGSFVSSGIWSYFAYFYVVFVSKGKDETLANSCVSHNIM